MGEFKFGMTLGEVLETFELPIPHQVSEELLREIVCVGGMNLIHDIMNKKNVTMQKNLKEYFSSKFFEGDIQIIAYKLANKLPGYRYWLELRYTPTPNNPKRIALQLGYDTNIQL